MRGVQLLDPQSRVRMRSAKLEATNNNTAEFSHGGATDSKSGSDERMPEPCMEVRSMHLGAEGPHLEE